MWRYRRRRISFWEIVIYALIAGIYYIYTSGAGPAVLTIIGMLGGTLAIWGFIRYFNTRLLLRLSIVIENQRAGRGETVRFKVKVDPSDKTSVSSITAILRCIRSEQLRDEYDIPTTRSNDTAEEYQITLTEDTTFKRDEIQYFNGEFLIPSDAMVTDLDGDLQAHWYLIAQAHLSVPPPAIVQEEIIVTRQRVAPQGTTSYVEDKLYPGDASDLFRDKTISSKPHLEIEPAQQATINTNATFKPAPVNSGSEKVKHSLSNIQEQPQPAQKPLPSIPYQSNTKDKTSFSHIEIEGNPPKS